MCPPPLVGVSWETRPACVHGRRLVRRAHGRDVVVEDGGRVERHEVLCGLCEDGLLAVLWSGGNGDGAIGETGDGAPFEDVGEVDGGEKAVEGDGLGLGEEGHGR